MPVVDVCFDPLSMRRWQRHEHICNQALMLWRGFNRPALHPALDRVFSETVSERLIEHLQRVAPLDRSKLATVPGFAALLCLLCERIGLALPFGLFRYPPGVRLLLVV